MPYGFGNVQSKIPITLAVCISFVRLCNEGTFSVTVKVYVQVFIDLQPTQLMTVRLYDGSTTFQLYDH